MSKNQETILQNQIRKAIEPIAMCYRANVGVFKTIDGRFINSGIPKGFTDLFGFRKSDGKMFFIEVKTDKGQLRTEQLVFSDTVQKYPILYGVARSVDDALEIILQDLPYNITTGTQTNFFKG